MSQLGELDCLFCFQKVMTAHYLIATGDVVVCKMRPPFLWCSRYLPKQCAMLNCTLLCISNHLRCSSNSDRICKKLFVDPIPPLLLLPSWLHYRERKERENGIFFFFLHSFCMTLVLDFFSSYFIFCSFWELWAEFLPGSTKYSFWFWLENANGPKSRL